jgi:hypothetical protein
MKSDRFAMRRIQGLVKKLGRSGSLNLRSEPGRAVVPTPRVSNAAFHLGQKEGRTLEEKMIVASNVWKLCAPCQEQKSKVGSTTLSSFVSPYCLSS